MLGSVSNAADLHQFLEDFIGPTRTQKHLGPPDRSLSANKSGSGNYRSRFEQ